jgi:aminomethyltransferase
VEIDEIDVSPLQVQGPLSEDMMADLVGDSLRDIPYYGLMEAKIAGCPVVISQTGFSGEKGYEVYLRNATETAEKVWYALRGIGAQYGLRVIAPGHHRRIAAGILSWGQDMDAETSPFQVNLAYQVPRKKTADYIGKETLERQRKQIEAGEAPFRLRLVGLKMGGRPITNYAPDFWLIQNERRQRCGYVTSPWYAPDLQTNIALGYVPWEGAEIGTGYKVELPETYLEASGKPVDAVVSEVPFVPSAHPSAREQAKIKGHDASD